MTNKAKMVLEAMAILEERDAGTTENEWFEASRISKLLVELHPEIFGELENPVMTTSSVLTHMKRERLVERQVSTDKKFAWWRRTSKGKELVSAPES